MQSLYLTDNIKYFSKFVSKLNHIFLIGEKIFNSDFY